jgi:hypothetical protein
MIRCQSQSHFTTCGLPSISSSWPQAPWDSRPVFFFSSENLWSKSLCNILSDESVGLLFTIAAGLRQLSHSQVRVPRDTRPQFPVSESRLPPTWRARSPYLYPPGTGWPGYTPRHWVPFSSPPTTRRAMVLFERAIHWQDISCKNTLRLRHHTVTNRVSHSTACL